MNPIAAALPVLLLSICVACQDAPRERRPAGGDALLGVWIGTGADQERLEFHRDGRLLVGQIEARYRTSGNQLFIDVAAESVTGTWRVVEPHLSIVLRLADGGSRSERYRRHGRQPAAAAPPSVERSAERLAVGGATFELPHDWRIARTDGHSALLDLGFGAAAASEAMVVVTSGDVPADVQGAAANELLRGRLRETAAELAEIGVQIDTARAVVRPVRLADGAGAELLASGTSGGERPVSVWIGTICDHTRFAAVLAVTAAGQQDRFVPGARSILRTLQLVAAPADDVSPDDASARGDDGGTVLAGLSFGHSTFGGGSSLTCVYSFGTGGEMRVRRMFSSSVGGSDSTTPGTFTVTGDAVTMQVGDDVVQATIERAGAEVRALRIGAARYARS